MNMNADSVREQLIGAIQSLLQSARIPVPEITDETCPLDISGFDSQTWPYVMSELEEVLEIKIPDDANIFLSKQRSGSKPRKLSIVEIVQVLQSLEQGGQA